MTVHNGNFKNRQCILPPQLRTWIFPRQPKQVLNGSQHKLRLFRFLKRLLFSEDKKCNTAKSIKWLSLLLTGLPKGRFIKCLQFFFQCIFLIIPGGGVQSTLQTLTLDLFQTNSYSANVRHTPPGFFVHKMNAINNNLSVNNYY